MSTQDLPLRVESRKMVPRFIRPFHIQEIISPRVIRLKLPRSMRVHPTFHISHIKLVRESPLMPAEPPPLPPQVVDGAP